MNVRCSVEVFLNSVKFNFARSVLRKLQMFSQIESFSVKLGVCGDIVCNLDLTVCTSFLLNYCNDGWLLFKKHYLT